MRKLFLAVLAMAVLVCACSRDYPDEVRFEFMKGCTGGEAWKESRCKCMLEGIEEAYELDEFTHIEKEIILLGKPWPKKMMKVALACKATT